MKFVDLIPWVDTTLKVSRLLATSLEILVTNTKFSLALATSWSQFQTLPTNLSQADYIITLDYTIKTVYHKKMKDLAVWHK